MIKKILCIAGLCFFALSPVSLGDDAKPKCTDAEVKEGFWTATFQTGQYVVGLGHICSIAKQTYLLDNNLLIREVSIETPGSALARFYYIEPFINGENSETASHLKQRSGELADEAVKRAGSNTGGMDKDSLVIKQYPTTSHAKSIEFRISSAQELDALYNSVVTAWKVGRGRHFSCK